MSLFFVLFFVTLTFSQLAPGMYNGMAYSQDGSNISYSLQWNVKNYPTETNATIGEYVLTFPSGKCGGSLTMYQTAEVTQTKEFGTTCMEDGLAYFFETSATTMFSYMLVSKSTFYPGYFEQSTKR